MQMESYTAEKRILNQQLGWRRANRVDACFSSVDQLVVGGRIPTEICMRICCGFTSNPARLFSFNPLFVAGTIDETASSGFRFFFDIPRKTADHPPSEGRYKYLFVGIFRI